MIDMSKAKWEISKEEKYAAQWFEDNGFDAVLEKQYISKTIFTVTKDGVSDKWELPQGLPKINLKKVMEQFKTNWDMLCELQRLRKQVAEQ